jgi:septal ring factor EnvC (AmiA/AmiB activator)
MRKLIHLLWIGTAMLLQACHQQDIVLVNEIKTLDAKWIRTSEQLTDLHKSLPKWEEKISFAIAEIKQMEGQGEDWMDSVIQVQKGILSTLQSESGTFEVFKSGFQDAVSAFGMWQKDAIRDSGKKNEAIRKELSGFQLSFETQKQNLDSIRARIFKVAEEHNTHRKNLMQISEWLQYDAIQVRY